MWENKENYNGLSLLPYDGGTYQQAPFESCNKETYDKLFSYLEEANIDLKEILEYNDNTDFNQQAACAGGNCEII